MRFVNTRNLKNKGRVKGEKIKSKTRKNALIGDAAKTRMPEMDVSLYRVQSVTQVLMGEGIFMYS